MPVPKRKVSKSRRDKRSANKGIKNIIITFCPTCQASVFPHRVCKECGYYKGEKILRTKIERFYERNKDKNKEEIQKNTKQTMAEQQQEIDQTTIKEENKKE